MVRAEHSVGPHCIIAHNSVAAHLPSPHQCRSMPTGVSHLHIIHVYLQSLLSTAKQFLMSIPSVADHTFVWAKALSSVCFFTVCLLSLLLLCQRTNARPFLFSQKTCFPDYLRRAAVFVLPSDTSFGEDGNSTAQPSILGIPSWTELF